MALNYQELVEQALALELGGDLPGALNIWYALEGPFAVVSHSKDGYTVTYNAEARTSKIAQLERRIGLAAGAGKVKHIPMVVVPVARTPASGSTVYDADGYAWGY
jgi:hypothetical protein